MQFSPSILGCYLKYLQHAPSSLTDQMDKFASYSDTNPKTRVAKLEKEREVIDQEIKQIKKTGIVLGWRQFKS